MDSAAVPTLGPHQSSTDLTTGPILAGWRTKKRSRFGISVFAFGSTSAVVLCVVHERGIMELTTPHDESEVTVQRALTAGQL